MHDALYVVQYLYQASSEGNSKSSINSSWVIYFTELTTSGTMNLTFTTNFGNYASTI